MNKITKVPDKKEAPVLGIDLGGTKILASVVDPTGKIIARSKKKTKAEKPWRVVISRIAECAKDAAEISNIPLADFAAAGIGAPGALNPDTGIINLAPNLNWENVNLREILEQELQIPVFINNDVNMGTLGECRMGSGVGMKNVVGIFIGTGIGGGIILDGKIYGGASYMAGEIGHIPMVDNGPLCGCGKKGCFEAVAGRLAIVRDIIEGLKKGKESILSDEVGENYSKIKSRRLALAWNKRDPLTVKVLKKAAVYIGKGVATVITILSPDAVILGGGLIEAIDEDFLELIKKSAEANSFPSSLRNTKIIRALLGDDAGILGSALYARECLSKK
jgi:glucokinase